MARRIMTGADATERYYAAIKTHGWSFALKQYIADTDKILAAQKAAEKKARKLAA